MDEAGHAEEPLALAGLAGLAGPRTRVVLAGGWRGQKGWEGSAGRVALWKMLAGCCMLPPGATSAFRFCPVREEQAHTHSAPARLVYKPKMPSTHRIPGVNPLHATRCFNPLPPRPPGDPQQLGPVILSPHARRHGMATSLLERLAAGPPYARREGQEVRVPAAAWVGGDNGVRSCALALWAFWCQASAHESVFSPDSPWLVRALISPSPRFPTPRRPYRPSYPLALCLLPPYSSPAATLPLCVPPSPALPVHLHHPPSRQLPLAPRHPGGAQRRLLPRRAAPGGQPGPNPRGGAQQVEQGAPAQPQVGVREAGAAGAWAQGRVQQDADAECGLSTCIVQVKRVGQARLDTPARV